MYLEMTITVLCPQVVTVKDSAVILQGGQGIFSIFTCNCKHLLPRSCWLGDCNFGPDDL